MAFGRGERAALHAAGYIATAASLRDQVRCGTSYLLYRMPRPNDTSHGLHRIIPYQRSALDSHQDPGLHRHLRRQSLVVLGRRLQWRPVASVQSLYGPPGRGSAMERRPNRVRRHPTTDRSGVRHRSHTSKSKRTSPRATGVTKPPRRSQPRPMTLFYMDFYRSAQPGEHGLSQ